MRGYKYKHKAGIVFCALINNFTTKTQLMHCIIQNICGNRYDTIQYNTVLWHLNSVCMLSIWFLCCIHPNNSSWDVFNHIFYHEVWRSLRLNDNWPFKSQFCIFMVSNIHVPYCIHSSHMQISQRLTVLDHPQDHDLPQKYCWRGFEWWRIPLRYPSYSSGILSDTFTHKIRVTQKR